MKFACVTSYTYCPDMEPPDIREVKILECTLEQANQLADSVGELYRAAADGNDSFFSFDVLDLSKDYSSVDEVVAAAKERIHTEYGAAAGTETYDNKTYRSATNTARSDQAWARMAHRGTETQLSPSDQQVRGRVRVRAYQRQGTICQISCWPQFLGGCVPGRR